MRGGRCWPRRAGRWRGSPALRTREYRAAARPRLPRARSTTRSGAAARVRRRAHPDDPWPPTSCALALCWKVEQRPESTPSTASCRRRRRTRWRRADAALRARPRRRARAVRPRRGQRRAQPLPPLPPAPDATPRAPRRGCARTCCASRALDPEHARRAVRPRPLRLLRRRAAARGARSSASWPACPGGDRARGLASIEEAAARSRSIARRRGSSSTRSTPSTRSGRARAMDQLDELRRRYPEHRCGR